MTARRPGLIFVRLLLRIAEAGPARLWLAFAVALAVCFGLWWQLLAATTSGLERLLAALTLTVQAVVLNVSPDGFLEDAGPGLGRGFHIMLRAMLLVLPILASASIVRALFHDRLRPLLFRWAAAKASDHTLVVGAGRVGGALVQSCLHDPDEAVVGVIEQQGYTEGYSDLFHGPGGDKLLWIGGDARRGGTLASRGCGRPRRVYLAAGGGQNNLAILDSLIAQRESEPPTGEPMEVLVGLEDPLQQEVLEAALARQRRLAPGFADRFWVRGFHLEALAARHAFQRFWPFEAAASGQVALVLIGDGTFAVELLDQIARLGHFDPEAKTRLRWIVPPDSAPAARLLARNHGLDPAAGGSVLAASIHPVIQLEVIERDISCLSAGDALRQALLMDGQRPQCVLAAAPQRERNEWLAQRVRRELLRMASEEDGQGAQACQVVAVIERGEEFDLEDAPGAVSLRQRRLDADPQGWEHFEVLRSAVEALRRDRRADLLAMLAACTFERIYSAANTAVPGTDTLAQARLAAEDFDARVAAFFGEAGGARHALRSALYRYWSRCGAEERWANRDTVDHIPLKITAALAGCDDSELIVRLQTLITRLRESAPQPDGPRWCAVEFDALMDALQDLLEERINPAGSDALLRIEHRRWAAFKLANGWRLGPRSAAARLNPHLVDFDALDAHEQGKDALFVRLIPVLLRLLWRHTPQWQADAG